MNRPVFLILLTLLSLLVGCATAAPSGDAKEAELNPKEEIPMTTRRVLFVLTSHSQLGDREEPTGVYWPELAHAYEVFTQAEVPVEFASVKGGQVPLYGMDKDDEAIASFAGDEALMARLHASMSPDQIKPERYAAIYYVGGHGTMWDFPDQARLAQVAASIYERDGIVSAVCHGPAALVNIKLKDGSYLVAGKKVAAFSNEEEQAAGLTEVVPFLLQDKLAQRGAVQTPAPAWSAHVIIDGHLVTGQNPASAYGVARAVLKLMDESAR